MSWNRVYLIRPGQPNSGPHPIEHVLSWYESGQLGSDVVLLDSESGERCSLEQFVRLPTGLADTVQITDVAKTRLITAWACLAVSVPTMVCCCWVAWIFPLASGLLALQGRAEAQTESELLQWNAIGVLSLLAIGVGVLLFLFLTAI